MSKFSDIWFKDSRMMNVSFLCSKLSTSALIFSPSCEPSPNIIPPPISLCITSTNPAGAPPPPPPPLRGGAPSSEPPPDLSALSSFDASPLLAFGRAPIARRNSARVSSNSPCLAPSSSLELF